MKMYKYLQLLYFYHMRNWYRYFNFKIIFNNFNYLNIKNNNKIH